MLHASIVEKIRMCMVALHGSTNSCIWRLLHKHGTLHVFSGVALHVPCACLRMPHMHNTFCICYYSGCIIINIYLAYVVFGDQDVSGSQISVDECLTGKVAHPRGNVLTESKHAEAVYPPHLTHAFENCKFIIQRHVSCGILGIVM